MIRKLRPGSLSVAVLTGFLIAAGVQLFSRHDLSLSRLFANATGAVQSTTGLLQSHNLVYEGAFRIPMGNPADDVHSANYGGGCLTYNPAGNGGQGSLLVCGMDTVHTVGEISVPAPVISTSLSSLPTASLVNNFVDVLQGHARDIYGPTETGSVKLGGLLVHNGKLIVSVYGYFDTDADKHPNSHFLASADLSRPQYLGGPYQVGDPAMPGFVSGYMTPIPAAFQGVLGGLFFTGQNSLAIIGRTSSGPSVSVFDPNRVGQSNPVPATRVVGYPINHPTLGDWYGQNAQMSPRLWDGASRAGGAVFPNDSRSVLFIGNRGTGPFCYGEATSNPALHGQEVMPGLIYCYDPTQTGKGPTSYPYKFVVWAYDANDLAAVKAGSKNYWDVVPYATWDLTLPILYPTGSAANYSIGSVAYDPSTQRVFVAQKNVDANKSTIINVFSVQTGASSSGLCR